MISTQARSGFRHFLSLAVQGSLGVSPEARCELEPLATLEEIRQTKMVVLTIATYLFRAIVLIHFSPDRLTGEFFAKARGTGADEMTGQALQDAIAESGNICCGILNRELSAFFPHIGMSTPNIIDRQCAAHLAELDCSHVEHFRLTGEDAAPICVSLCLCAYAEVDFAPDLTEQTVSTGELELF